MAYKVIVTQPVSLKIGAIGLSRNKLLLALNRLYEQLQDHADKYRSRRSPSHAEDHFLFELVLRDEGQKHQLRFHVNDRIATDILIVEDLTVRSLPG